jgi:hypothetical protein
MATHDVNSASPGLSASTVAIPLRTMAANAFVAGKPKDSSVFTQRGDGFVLTNNDTFVAMLDRDARLHTRNYRIEMVFDGLWAAAKTVPVIVHEFGNLIVLHVETCYKAASTSASVVTSTNKLPAEIRPTSRVATVISIMDNAAKALGVVDIFADGTIQVGNAVSDAVFTTGANAGWESFTIMYDRRI